jgi:transglutaminase-like putative cysteine protease
LTVETKRSLRVEYSAPVRDCLRSLRVFPPAARGGQRVVELDWRCDSPPDFSEESEDEFGNRVLRFRHEKIASAFSFEMTLVTSHDESTPVARESNVPPSGIGAFLLPSALCDWTFEIETIARELQASHSMPRRLVEEICKFAYNRVKYSPGATHLKTSASQSLQFKKGVCQDHAHLMIALCRACKIPARYISGYIKGEGAMHAWVEVLIEEKWRGFDPTHNREARSDYVFVACARDARDCAPHEGSFRGRATAKLESWCKTTSRA